MISTILFSLSALCFAALFSPSKSATKPSASMPVYTYYVCDDMPVPTWQRKGPSPARVAQRCG
jgi:hypothetical protein